MSVSSRSALLLGFPRSHLGFLHCPGHHPPTSLSLVTLLMLLSWAQAPEPSPPLVAQMEVVLCLHGFRIDATEDWEDVRLRLVRSSAGLVWVVLVIIPVQ